MVKTQTTKNTTEFKSAPVRLWVKSKFLSFKRNRKNQTPNQAILRVEDVNTP
jgi:ribosomal protein L35AE/L33A